MVRCAVKSCKNDSRRQTKGKCGISFHRFPRNRERAKKWTAAIKRDNWEPNSESSVCSIHFDALSITETRKGLRKLIEGAIPELYIDDQETEGAKSNDIIFVSTTSHDLSTNDSTSDTSAFPDKIMPECACGRSSYTEGAEPNDPLYKDLKRKILYINEIAKRRRLRCNALYAERRRMKRKIALLKHTIEQLRENQIEEQDDTPESEVPEAT